MHKGGRKISRLYDSFNLVVLLDLCVLTEAVCSFAVDN